LVWSYTLFLYSTPFLVSSILFSLAYVHFYVPDMNPMSGHLPVFPDHKPLLIVSNFAQSLVRTLW